MNSAFTVHNSEICLPKSTKAGQKKKRENANWKNADAANAEPKRSQNIRNLKQCQISSNRSKVGPDKGSVD